MSSQGSSQPSSGSVTPRQEADPVGVPVAPSDPPPRPQAPSIPKEYYLPKGRGQYIQKPFAGRRAPMPMQPDVNIADLDIEKLHQPAKGARGSRGNRYTFPGNRPASWRLNNLNHRLEKQNELPPVAEETESILGDDKSERRFTKNISSRFRRTSDTPTPKGRPNISLPVQLVSASNKLAYDAPDLEEARAAHERHQSHSSVNSSGDETEKSFLSDPGMTDASSMSDGTATPSQTPPAQSPTASTFTEPLSAVSTEPSPTASNFSETIYPPSYNPSETSLHTLPYSPSVKSLYNPIVVADATMVTMAPAIPQRAQSHSKREHMRIARQRSGMSAPSTRPHSEVSTLQGDGMTEYGDVSPVSESANPFASENPTPYELEMRANAAHHPFDPELREIDNMAIGLARPSGESVRDEQEHLEQSGLGVYHAKDYQFDLDSLVGELSLPEDDGRPTSLIGQAA